MALWRRDGERAFAGRFRSGDHALAFETMGEGDTVIFVHGFASSLVTNWKNSGCFQAVVDAGFMAAGFDARGHGQSDRPIAPGSYDPDEMAEDIRRFAAHLGVECAHFVAYSMGARIVLRLLHQSPKLVRSAILGGVGDGVGRSNTRFAEMIAHALLAADASAITDRVARRFRIFAENQGNDLRVLAQCVREVMKPIDFASIAQIACPVLVLAGGEDDQIEDPEALARRIPGARTQIISGRNHMTVIGDARFRQAIVNFLRQP